jgi:hypothetical protein
LQPCSPTDALDVFQQNDRSVLGINRCPVRVPLSASLGPSAKLVKNPYNIFRQPNAVASSARDLNQDAGIDKAVDSDLGVDG